MLIKTLNLVIMSVLAYFVGAMCWMLLTSALKQAAAKDRRQSGRR